MRLLLVLALFSTLMCSPASAQWPPERIKNLKVIPGDIPIRALIDTMAGFTRALGVRCTYCHVGREEDPIESYDFAADDKAPKLKAREMLRMVQAINNEHLTKLADRRTPGIVVTCATCHHGVAEPRPIQQILLTAYDAAGADSAEAAYRRLRTRYYGYAAYDFGEVPLADVATALRRRGRLADAVRFYVLNTEFVPGSGFAHRQLAEGHLAAGDTASAITSLQRALGINPNDPQARPRLDGLRPKT
jgi:tetratricopeptide (TPR) repeat protein